MISDLYAKCSGVRDGRRQAGKGYMAFRGTRCEVCSSTGKIAGVVKWYYAWGVGDDRRVDVKNRLNLQDCNSNCLTSICWNSAQSHAFQDSLLATVSKIRYSCSFVSQAGWSLPKELCVTNRVWSWNIWKRTNSWRVNRNWVEGQQELEVTDSMSGRTFCES